MNKFDLLLSQTKHVLKSEVVISVGGVSKLLVSHQVLHRHRVSESTDNIAPNGSVLEVLKTEGLTDSQVGSGSIATWTTASEILKVSSSNKLGFVVQEVLHFVEIVNLIGVVHINLRQVVAIAQVASVIGTQVVQVGKHTN